MPGQYIYTAYSWPMIAAAGIVGALSVYAWRRRSVPGALPFAAMTAMALPWALGVALEVAAVDLGDKVFWVKFEHLWQLPTATAGLWFALDYTNLNRWLARPTLILLAIPPLLYVVLAFTNDSHGWLWRGFTFDGKVHLLPGKASWALVDYNMILAVVTALIFVWLFLESPLHRKPVALCLCGHAAMRVAYLFETAGVNPIRPFDPAMVAGSFAYVMYAFALFHYRLFDLVPVAYGTVVEQMREGMVVLDARHRIVDLNPAAEKILGMSGRRARGISAVQVLPALTDSGTWLAGAGAPPREVSLGSGAAARRYAVHFSPLQDRHRFPRGHLLLLRDVTEQKRALGRILAQQRALATLQERDLVARELHDSLGQVLGFLKMQAQTARHLIAKNQPAEADGCLDKLVVAAQDAQVDVREYIVGARAGATGRDGFLSSLDQYLRRFKESSGIAVRLEAPQEFGGQPFEPMVSAQLLRIIQEALTNVRKHAATREAHVRLAIVDGEAEAVVEDKGAGFDPAVLETAEGEKFGLRFMRERAQEVGGRVRIHSAPGQGTKIAITVPVLKEPS